VYNPSPTELFPALREEEMAETTRSDAETARMIFYVVAVLMAIYGLGLLFFPQAIFALSNDPGVPANPGWVRWGGGFVLGTAVAAWLAGSKPESQWPLMMGLATAFILVTLALLYGNLVGDYRGVQWLSWLQIVGNGILAGVMLWLTTKFAA
jgi:biotin transporter BioY